jgi:hypothetical protein
MCGFNSTIVSSTLKKQSLQQKVQSNYITIRDFTYLYGINPQIWFLKIELKSMFNL